MEIHYSRSDIVRLFKATFGTELDVDLLNEHGFTVSPALSRAVLGKVKLADLTLGDLAAITNAASKTEAVAEEKPAVPETSKPFLRRI